MAERLDGRDNNTLRQLSMSRAGLHRADGSASWTQEGTEVLACVYGPVEASARRENSEKAVVEVLYRPLAGMVGQAEREAEALVRRTVEASLLGALHPRTTVQVVLQASRALDHMQHTDTFCMCDLQPSNLPFLHDRQRHVLTFVLVWLQVISDDGSLLACAINAACFALLDAGLPMARLFMAVSCCLTAEGELLVDPLKEEEESAEAVVCVALEGISHGAEEAPKQPEQTQSETMVMASWTRGRLTEEQYFEAVGMARKAQVVMDDFACKSLAQYYNRSSEVATAAPMST